MRDIIPGPISFDLQVASPRYQGRRTTPAELRTKGGLRIFNSQYGLDSHQFEGLWVLRDTRGAQNYGYLPTGTKAYQCFNRQCGHTVHTIPAQYLKLSQEFYIL